MTVMIGITITSSFYLSGETSSDLFLEVYTPLSIPRQLESTYLATRRAHNFSWRLSTSGFFENSIQLDDSVIMRNMLQIVIDVPRGGKSISWFGVRFTISTKIGYSEGCMGKTLAKQYEKSRSSLFV